MTYTFCVCILRNAHEGEGKPEDKEEKEENEEKENEEDEACILKQACQVAAFAGVGC